MAGRLTRALHRTPTAAFTPSKIYTSSQRLPRLSGKPLDSTMNSLRVAMVILGSVLAGCSTVKPCTAPPDADLGGWMTSDDPELGVHQSCLAGDHRFVLKALMDRNAQGQVTRWDELTEVVVRVRRGERLMYGFDCGSGSARGDVIALVDDRTGRPLRAWRIDSSTRQFVLVSPQSVTCESLE